MMCFSTNHNILLRTISLGRNITCTNLACWAYLPEPSRMGHSPCLSFRFQETSSRQPLRVQSTVRSGVPSYFQSFADETPSLVKIEPILRIELRDTNCWAFDWANSDVVAIGCTNGGSAGRWNFRGFLTISPGAVAIYNISDPLKEGKPLGEG